MSWFLEGYDSQEQYEKARRAGLRNTILAVSLVILVALAVVILTPSNKQFDEPRPVNIDTRTGAVR